MGAPRVNFTRAMALGRKQKQKRSTKKQKNKKKKETKNKQLTTTGKTHLGGSHGGSLGPNGNDGAEFVGAQCANRLGHTGGTPGVDGNSRRFTSPILFDTDGGCHIRPNEPTGNQSSCGRLPPGTSLCRAGHLVCLARAFCPDKQFGRAFPNIFYATLPASSVKRPYFRRFGLKGNALLQLLCASRSCRQV